MERVGICDFFPRYQYNEVHKLLLCSYCMASHKYVGKLPAFNVGSFQTYFLQKIIFFNVIYFLETF